ncbi:hypothetical protein P3S67_005655 [Capsicum chacoense]
MWRLSINKTLSRFQKLMCWLLLLQSKLLQTPLQLRRITFLSRAHRLLRKLIVEKFMSPQVPKSTPSVVEEEVPVAEVADEVQGDSQVVAES